MASLDVTANIIWRGIIVSRMVVGERGIVRTPGTNMTFKQIRRVQVIVRVEDGAECQIVISLVKDKFRPDTIR